jgi:hypothetical protein
MPYEPQGVKGLDDEDDDDDDDDDTRLSRQIPVSLRATKR